MEQAQKLILTFFLCSALSLLNGIEVAESSSRHHHRHRHRHRHHHGHVSKLFVFGDSYADTGNDIHPLAKSWKVPYGITYPGRPSGRFSDGRLFTDYLAKFLGLTSPVPYKFRRYGPNDLKHGLNFAFGGSGVFDTTSPYPNMTTQIDYFERLLKDSVFKHSDLQNSIAYVSLVGNDYSAYISRNGSNQGLPTFIPQVVNQLVVDIQRIYNLGVKKISVTALQPLGCLPSATIQNSYQKCDDISNKLVQLHNLLLQQAVTKFNNQTTHDNATPIVIIDLYDAFLSILQIGETQHGSSSFDKVMEPCCKGISQNYTCGSVDGKGNKMYMVCQDPKSHFFWDEVHPTQAGWKALTIALQANLDELKH